MVIYGYIWSYVVIYGYIWIYIWVNMVKYGWIWLKQRTYSWFLVNMKQKMCGDWITNKTKEVCPGYVPSIGKSKMELEELTIELEGFDGKRRCGTPPVIKHDHRQFPYLVQWFSHETFMGDLSHQDGFLHEFPALRLVHASNEGQSSWLRGGPVAVGHFSGVAIYALKGIEHMKISHQGISSKL